MQTYAKNFEPKPQDLAMEAFRQMFPVGFKSCFIYNDGKKMNYKNVHLRAAVDNLKRAHEIITQQNLPLTAKVFSDYQNHLLVISFKNPQA